jgi:hypothetical protein
MDPFLKLVAQDIYTKHGSEMQNICILFPNRRSILFFNKYLSQTIKKTSWAPQCITISDYIQELSNFQLADKLLLLFDLYKVYCQVFKSTETFDDFYFWGELMLSDFNDIDKYLIDANDLFQNLSAFKNINEQFSYLDENQLEAIKQFWKNFGESGQSNHHHQFSYNWSLMKAIYNQFRETIGKKNLAYEGMQYRQVAEQIIKNSFSEPAYKKIAIVGFNALSECEKVLFRHLKNQEKAVFYWDYNEDFIQQPLHEAGFFIRKNMLEFPSALEAKYFNNQITPEKIELIAIPSHAGQAKVAGQIINQNFLDNGELENTAIILTDESLLMPVLHSIPPEVSDVNITMGYPVKNASIVDLIESIGPLYLNARRNKKTQVSQFYYKNVLSVLNHSYLSEEKKEEIRKLKAEIINKNLIYIESSALPGSEPFNLIFQQPVNGPDFLKKLSEIIKIVGRNSFGNQISIEEQPAGIEAETLVLVYTSLNRFYDLVLQSNLELDIQICFRLLIKALSSLTLPFEGEPLKGLQIMGLLESRAIGFENIILLNVNEGCLPKTNIPPSFIPYNLRHGFGLPTLEYRDAIYAYYFYRIIQRAKKVYLLYNTKSDKMGSTELSRYAVQMLYNDKYKILRRSQTFNIVPVKIPGINITKSPEVMNILGKYYISSNSDYYLSPSALSSYIDCSLRFYFRYIAGLKEYELPAEEIDASMLGSILHDAMQNLYKPFLNSKILPSNLENLLKSNDKVEKVLRNSLAKKYFKDAKITDEDLLQGRNIIIFRILDKYIRQIIETDIKISPFSLIALEQNVIKTFEIKVKSETLKIKVGGNIDRIDQIKSTIRIIDYKTGNVESKFSNFEELFKPEEGKKAKKEIFQALLYSMLFKNINNFKEAVIPGIYNLRKIFGDHFDPNIYYEKETITDISKIENDFSENLQNILEEIYNPEVMFSQTTDLKKCSLCDYKIICHREDE